MTWTRPSTAGAASAADLQPPLAFDPEPEPLPVALGDPRPTGHRVRMVAVASDALPPPGLPDPGAWSASMALAFAEALQGRRAVGQLSRWVDERVLATLNLSVRRLRRCPGRSSTTVRPALLRSVHLQLPRRGIVEVSAHVQIGAPSSALAFRLEAWHDRWLCTVLELGPQEQVL
ncbi:MAG TPA: Rv3235 family protein [Propionibacteriaceae bacterium]